MSEIHVGETVGKYRIIQQIGSGGQGSVFLGLHCRTAQLWALKEIPVYQGREAYREVQALRGLHHRALPTVADILETEDTLIIVMEYIRGRDLSRILIDKHHLPAQQLYDTAYQITSALIYLHSRSPAVLHLDIKPANIICCEDHRLVLVDFGAAALMGAGGCIRKGTSGYAPPEMLSPGGQISVRSDIYELGASLYELAGGGCYNRADRRRSIAGCPAELLEVILKCVEENPANRYDDAQQLLSALNEAQKRERWEKKRIQFWSVCILALGVCVLAGRTMRTALSAAIQSPESTANESSDNVALEPHEEAAPVLEQEAMLTIPEDTTEGQIRYIGHIEQTVDSLLRDLDQMIEQISAYGVLSEEDDRQIRKILITIPDRQDQTWETLMQEKPQQYGQRCFSLGCLYCFTCSLDNAQDIAGEWFGKAVIASGQMETEAEWVRLAQLYERLCGGSAWQTQEELELAEAQRMGITEDTRQKEAELRLSRIEDILEEEPLGSAGSALRLRQWIWLSEELASCSAYLSDDAQMACASSALEEIKALFTDDCEAAGLSNSDALVQQFDNTIKSVQLLLGSLSDEKQLRGQAEGESDL